MEGRRTQFRVAFEGADITEDIRPFFQSLTYVDSEDGAADDLNLTLQDRDGIWMQHWLAQAVQAAAGPGLRISCTILQRGWGEADAELESGAFELDSVAVKGPPAKVTIKATGLGFSTALRNVKRSRAWERCTLGTIAREIAANGGTSCLFEAARDPSYTRTEQDKESDIAFLERLCKDAGLALKCTDGRIVIFDQAVYEAQEPFDTIVRGQGPTSYDLRSRTAETKYTSCRVSYWDAGAAKLIEGTAYIEDFDPEGENNRQLELTERVESVAQAQALAARRLKLHNQFSRVAYFTMPGDVRYMAGRTVLLENWGGWDGKYMVAEAENTVDAKGGHETQITVRNIPDQGADAAAVAQVSAGGRRYRVKRGDDLSKIAQAFYGSAALWQKIYQANRAVIGADPSLIRPGQELTIP